MKKVLPRSINGVSLRLSAISGHEHIDQLRPLGTEQTDTGSGNQIASSDMIDTLQYWWIANSVNNSALFYFCSSNLVTGDR